MKDFHLNWSVLEKFETVMQLVSFHILSQSNYHILSSMKPTMGYLSLRSIILANDFISSNLSFHISWTNLRRCSSSSSYQTNQQVGETLVLFHFFWPVCLISSCNNSHRQCWKRKTRTMKERKENQTKTNTHTCITKTPAREFSKIGFLSFFQMHPKKTTNDTHTKKARIQPKKTRDCLLDILISRPYCNIISSHRLMKREKRIHYIAHENTNRCSWSRKNRLHLGRGNCARVC